MVTIAAPSESQAKRVSDWRTGMCASLVLSRIASATVRVSGMRLWSVIRKPSACVVQSFQLSQHTGEHLLGRELVHVHYEIGMRARVRQAAALRAEKTVSADMRRARAD